MACNCAKIVQDTAGTCSPSNGKYAIQLYDCGTEQPISPAQFFKESTATFEQGGYSLYDAIGDSVTIGTAAYAANAAGITTGCLATIRVRVIGNNVTNTLTLEAQKKLNGTHTVDLNGASAGTTQIIAPSAAGTTVTIQIPAGGCMDFLRLNFMVGLGTIVIQGKTSGFGGDCGAPISNNAASDTTGDVIPANICWGYDVTISGD